MKSLQLMTAADKDTLKYIPDGWFIARSLPCMVRRPDYRCERLKKAGVLESRVIGVCHDDKWNPSLVRQYQKRSTA